MSGHAFLTGDGGISAVRVSLPMTSYISVVGVHTTLWSFVALYLPRTQLLGDLANSTWDNTPISSRDRPQHPSLTPTLLYICIGAVVLQSWWAGYLRDWWLKLGVRGTEEERKTEIALLNRQRLSIARNAWAATMAASFIIYCILLSFGAPITSLTLKTYLLALLVSVMAVFPPAYAIGVPTLGGNSASIVQRWTWVRLFVEFSSRNPVERALVYPAIGTVLGCWLGVIPIALDWDRPWQAWPLTPAFAAIAGYIVSSITALTVNSVVDLAEQHANAQVDAAEQKKAK
ncbi:GPI biosynthesis protein family Pig-F-domain-containing protein [Gymnopilus junonius]|uniref:GPI biosynthesis protein family Pig-F-domain-containing protein n=1 Tax=Gymnopilus junonius TaxID=109634 RepID=A0A9P5TRN6_GYMJU|nr:GPI biosynthesis protein family Pig-F-domain-containing protein [Gymnopilus junonius]